MSAVLDEKLSPGHDDLPGNGADSRGPKRNRMSADDEDDDDDKPGRERRKIEIKFIQDKSRRHITFSKRKAGIMKKAYELSVLTGTQVLLLVVSETGLVYTFTTPKLQPLVTKAEGKNLIQACLNAPDPAASENGVDAPDVAPEAPEDVAHSNVNAPQGNMRPGIHPGYMTNEQQQQMAYYQNLQQQQQQAGGQYPMPVGGRMPPQHQPTA
ncbi:Transcription factor MADS-box [Penicillium samsonianum]|uniref:Transcription factor MADS-box n=1 Tax=Penicillium samsonianum TaxID=1882272 RepID=UPI002548C850|nr:Transcription factor MADS-box [Penicillium samsonianum]KAJ6124476.1 Transcription factor MADS-box [Penicillium samsonianum]